ncbi:hypothetical protein PIB30_094262 [Stylosanthes scabra]|uniref:Uncharacterized protein n=1 Tax=Stylosanthes scabra TaxID=79078 RepID=A0ABU6VX73_9FABA|nr:hypothetical protein [Stylosanthes scabra]
MIREEKEKKNGLKKLKKMNFWKNRAKNRFLASRIDSPESSSAKESILHAKNRFFREEAKFCRILQQEESILLHKESILSTVIRVSCDLKPLFHIASIIFSKLSPKNSSFSPLKL